MFLDDRAYRERSSKQNPSHVRLHNAMSGTWTISLRATDYDHGRNMPIGRLTVVIMTFKWAKSGWAYWTWKKSNDDKSNLDKWSLRSVLKLANSFTPAANEKATAIYDSNGKSLTARTDARRRVNDKKWVTEVGRAREWWYESYRMTPKPRHFEVNRGSASHPA
ncbi:unnamed protein product [Aphanomyces euteiches]